MVGMFDRASSFNQPLGNWDVSNVENMKWVFSEAISFNQDISDWNVSSVSDFYDMFETPNALSETNRGKIHESFSSNPNWPYDWGPDEPDSPGNTGPVNLTDSNFQTAVNLWFSNQAEANATYGHISDWNTSAVTDMSGAFKHRTSFNEDIGGWDTSSVVSMYYMFDNASAFNQGIGSWDVSSVREMSGMFDDAVSFNQPIGDWNTSAVKYMAYTFTKAAALIRA